MKRDWLLYLVIFSLALNLGSIGTFAYLRFQDRRDAAPTKEPLPRHPREFWGRLNLDGGQLQTLRSLMPEHRRRLGDLRLELAQKRQELLALMKKEDAPWPEIQGKIREISQLQGRLEEEVVRHLLQFQKHLRPEQRTAFLAFVEQRLKFFRGAMGRPSGQPGPGQGPGCPPSSPEPSKP